MQLKHHQYIPKQPEDAVFGFTLNHASSGCLGIGQGDRLYDA
jgi:hypothetical protein